MVYLRHPLRPMIDALESWAMARRASRVRRAVLDLPQALSDARQRIDGTRASLADACPQVGWWAHQRLDEAERSLRSAFVVATSDPVDALAFARMARDLAVHADRFVKSQTGRRGHRRTIR